MSSIQNLSQSYEMLKIQSTGNNSARKTQNEEKNQSVSRKLSFDEVSISSEAMLAFEESRSSHARVNPLDELVENGTITEEQKQKIENVLQSSRKSETSTDESSPLSSLIANGTITAEQDEAIKAKFESAGPPPGGRPPGGPPPGGMPPSGASGSSESANSSTFDEETLNSILELIEDSETLSEEQKTVISEILDEFINKLSSNSDSDENSTSLSIVLNE